MSDAAPWASDPVDTSGFRPLTVRPSAAPAADAAPWNSDPVDQAAQGGDDAAAVGRGLVNGVPIAGPYLLAGADRLAAGVRSLQHGTPYADELAHVQAFDQATAEQHPIANGFGQFGGAALATLPGAALAPAAFGVEGATLAGRMAAGAATNAAIGGADAGVRSGGDIGAIGTGAILGGLGGAVGGALGRAAGEAAAQPASNGVVEAADRLGISVPNAVASDSRVVQAAGAGLRNVPFAGEPLMQAAEGTLRQIGDTADRTAAAVGTPGAANAGRGIQSAAQRAADQAAADQAAYEQAMGQQAGAGTVGANPLTVGGDVQARIGQFGDEVAAREAAPGQQLTADLGDLAGRLGPAGRVDAGNQITGGITRYAQEALPAQQEAAYNAALDLVPPNARTPLTATRDAAADIMGQRTDANLPNTTGGAVGMVADAIRNRAGLTVGGIQTLRRTVGELLRSPTLETSINRGELQTIYGALSDDLSNAVATHGGPEAAALFDQANALTRQGRQAVSAVNAVAQQSPERALNTVIGMAGTGSGGDAARLASIRGMVGDDGFANVPAAALDRISRDTAGTISPAIFARNVHGMTPEGSEALFGQHAPEVRELATRAAMLAQMPPDAGRPLADALARLGAGSPDRVLGNILSLASTGSRADLDQLANLRSTLGEGLWWRVGGALVRRSAFDDTSGAFRPDGLVALANNLKPQARMMLFGEGDARQALDAARRFGEQPFHASATEAQALKRSLGRSDEGAFDRVAAMASSGSRADIAQLARLRSTMKPQEWADVSATVIKGLGRDVQGNFSPDRFVTGWGKLSEAGKGILFPDKATRAALDDIATVSSRFKELHKYANPSGTARNTAFHVGALAGIWAEPVTMLSSLFGANVLSRILAAPATARSAANWAKVYDLAVTKPGAGTRNGLMVASRSFSSVVADKLGVRVPADSLAQGLSGQGAAKADPQRRVGGRIGQ